MKTLIKLACLAIAVVCCLDTVSAQTPTFLLSSNTLNYTSAVGFDPTVPDQTVTIDTSNGTHVNLTAQVSGLTGCNAVNLQFEGSTVTPTRLHIQPHTSTLPSGLYSCNVLINAVGVQQGTIAVNLTVGTGIGTGSTVLSVAPSSLTFSAQAGSIAGAQTLTLTNITTGSSVAYTATLPSDATWLSIFPAQGTVFTTLTVQVQASAVSLAAGSYSTNITFTPTNPVAQAFTVPVSFTVSGASGLQVTQAGSTVSSVSFAYQTGAGLPASQTLSLSTSASTSLQCTVSIGSGANFLVVTPTGNITVPATGGSTSLNLSIVSTSFAAGTYNGSIFISCPSASNPSTTIPVTLLVSATPLLTQTANPSPFNYQIGQSTPSGQTVQIGTTSTSVPLTITTSGQSWLMAGLSLSSASLTVPSTLTISVNPASLQVGTYNGSVTISSTGAGNTLTIPVVLNVSTSTGLNVTPSALTFTYQTSATSPAAQQILVSSTGALLGFNVGTSTSSCGGSWLSVNQSSGTASTTAVGIAVSVNPSGIASGSICVGTVSITPQNGTTSPVTVPVTLQVSSNPIIQLSQSAFNFTAALGGSAPATQLLTLTSSDSVTAIPYSIVSSAPWLTLVISSSSTPTNIQLSVSTLASNGLQVGVNRTTIVLFSSSLPSGSVNIPVTFTVTSNATVTVTPSSLTFAQATGGTAPASKTLNVAVTGDTNPYNFTATASSTIGSWLSVSPASGAVPGSVTVSVNSNAASLSPGTYQGQVSITVAGTTNPSQSIPVTLTVTSQSLSVSANALTFATQLGATSPPANQTFQVTSTGGPIAVTVGTTTASCPGFLTATPTSGTTPVTVTVGINIASLAAGTCTGTVTVSANGVATQSVSVTLNVTNPPAPGITSIVNGASFALGPIAPGEIVTLFGTNLGPATLAGYILNPNNTFATKVADTEVFFDTVAAPIIFTRTDQVAVVVPFEMTGRLNVNITVKHAGVTSTILQQRIADTAPGFFTVPAGGSGQGAIVNQNGVVNAPAAPAAKGSVVSFYITGAGQTNPQGVSGALSGTNPLNLISAGVSVTIGGQSATVLYAGGAPGNIQGLYQLNVSVPQTVSSGLQPVVVSVGGQQTQSGVNMAIQ